MLAAMTSSESELKNISSELRHLSFKKQQLLERRKVQCMIQELSNRLSSRPTAEEALRQHEIDRIDEKLQQLTERATELQKSHEKVPHGKDEKLEKKVTAMPLEMPEPKDTNSQQMIFFVEPPPNISAPQVFLDMDNLPPFPCRTQCPECRQFIVTETFTSVTSLTWMVCFMTAVLGCVAGCCLIPFCIDSFKSTTHKCPKCRTLLLTLNKL